MTIQTVARDPIDTLTSSEGEAAYLEAAFEDGDPMLLAAAIGDVARARVRAQIAEEAGLTRAAMCKGFRREGNPTLETLSRALDALDVELDVGRVTE